MSKHDPAIVLRQILEHAEEIQGLIASTETPRSRTIDCWNWPFCAFLR